MKMTYMPNEKGVKAFDWFIYCPTSDGNHNIFIFYIYDKHFPSQGHTSILIQNHRVPLWLYKMHSYPVYSRDIHNDLRFSRSPCKWYLSDRSTRFLAHKPFLFDTRQVHLIYVYKINMKRLRRFAHWWAVLSFWNAIFISTLITI